MVHLQHNYKVLLVLNCTCYCFYTCIKLKKFLGSCLQAPKEIVSLFSGSRQVVYGFVPHCKQVRRMAHLAVKCTTCNSCTVLLLLCHFVQASLRAFIGNKEIKTMVSTSDLAVTKGRVREITYFYVTPCSVDVEGFLRLIVVSFQTLHQLTARAIIRDWTEGSLDFDRTEHEVVSFLSYGSYHLFFCFTLLNFVGRL